MYRSIVLCVWRGHPSAHLMGYSRHQFLVVLLVFCLDVNVNVGFVWAPMMLFVLSWKHLCLKQWTDRRAACQQQLSACFFGSRFDVFVCSEGQWPSGKVVLMLAWVALALTSVPVRSNSCRSVICWSRLGVFQGNHSATGLLNWMNFMRLWSMITELASLTCESPEGPTWN